MSVLLSTLQDEVQTMFSESTSTTNGVFTDNFMIYSANRFYDQYGASMDLQGGPTSYTWTTAMSSVALTSINSAIVQVYRLETLDDSGDVSGELLEMPRGSATGFFIWNNLVYLNPEGDAPDTAISTRWFYRRKPTKATAISDAFDIHADYERSVGVPWFLYCGYQRAKKFSVADGYRAEFRLAFKDMMRERNQQYRPKFSYMKASEDYGPISG